MLSTLCNNLRSFHFRSVLTDSILPRLGRLGTSSYINRRSKRDVYFETRTIGVWQICEMKTLTKYGCIWKQFFCCVLIYKLRSKKFQMKIVNFGVACLPAPLSCLNEFVIMSAIRGGLPYSFQVMLGFEPTSMVWALDVHR